MCYSKNKMRKVKCRISEIPHFSFLISSLRASWSSQLYPSSLVEPRVLLREDQLPLHLPDRLRSPDVCSPSFARPSFGLSSPSPWFVHSSSSFFFAGRTPPTPLQPPPGLYKRMWKIVSLLSYWKMSKLH